MLHVFKIDRAKDLVEMVKRQTVAAFNQLSATRQYEYEHLQEKHTEIVAKINRLEERYIEEEIGRDPYHKYRDRNESERGEIDEKLRKLSRKVSNLEESITFAMKFALELSLKWVSADYNAKQRLQFLLFPKGITYCKKTDEYRTPRINLVFSYIAYLQKNITNKKRGITELGLDFASFSLSVNSSSIRLFSTANSGWIRSITWK